MAVDEVCTTVSNRIEKPSGSAEEPYNHKEMLERFEGDQEFISLIIALSREEIPERMNELYILLSQQEFVKARLEVHTIKGIAANISATPMRTAAAELEKKLATGAPLNIDLPFAALEARIKEALAALEQFFPAELQCTP